MSLYSEHMKRILNLPHFVQLDYQRNHDRVEASVARETGTGAPAPAPTPKETNKPAWGSKPTDGARTGSGAGMGPAPGYAPRTLNKPQFDDAEDGPRSSRSSRFVKGENPWKSPRGEGATESTTVSKEGAADNGAQDGTRRRDWGSWTKNKEDGNSWSRPNADAEGRPTGRSPRGGSGETPKEGGWGATKREGATSWGNSSGSTHNKSDNYHSRPNAGNRASTGYSPRGDGTVRQSESRGLWNRGATVEKTEPTPDQKSSEI